MGKLKIPKRIPVDVMRKVLGDKRTEDFLIVAFGPKLMGTSGVKIQKRVYENLLAQLEGREAGYALMPAVLRLYFAESPQSKGRLRMWLRKKIEDSPSTSESNGVTDAATQMVQETKKRGRPRKAQSRKASREKVNA